MHALYLKCSNLAKKSHNKKNRSLPKAPPSLPLVLLPKGYGFKVPVAISYKIHLHILK